MVVILARMISLGTRMIMADDFLLEGKTIWVPGSNGMVGSAIVRKISDYDIQLYATSRDEVNLLDTKQVNEFYKKVRPDAVILSAAKVGGIHANSAYPFDFIHQNLQIQQNVIYGAYKASVKKLLFLGSSCIYPKDCNQPIKEEYLMTGSLEPTNENYAIAKIAGIRLCQALRKQHKCDFISLMPTNLYGPNDNFHPLNSHVPAALLSRLHNAKMDNDRSVTVWGTGNVYREFLHVDDLADACIFALENYSDYQHLNVGTGVDISIRSFAELLKKIVCFDGDLVYDDTKPDGMFRKLLDVSRLNSQGWKSKIELKDGLKKYYQWYLEDENE